MGVSALEAAELVLAIQNKLGPGQTIGGDQLLGIVRKYARADRTKRFAGIGDSSLERRVNLTAAALAQTGKRAQPGRGGRGLVALSDKEIARFGGLLKRVAEADGLTDAQLKDFMELTLRLNDMDLQDRAAKVLRDRFGNTVDMYDFDAKLKGLRSQSKAVRKNKYLRKVLRAEHALDILDNERTIKIASRFGVSSNKLRSYIVR